MMRQNLDMPHELLRECCAMHHVRTLKLFGSALRNAFTPESDIDLLVEFESGIRMRLFAFHGIEAEPTEWVGR